MNSGIFWRVLWKEYRFQRSFLLGIIGLGLLLLWLCYSTVSMHVAANVVVLLPTLYAIASLAIMFAGEKEERTDELLNNWAVPALPLGAAKLVFLAGTTALVAAILWIVAVISKAKPEQEIAYLLTVGVSSVSPLSLIAWALFWSLLSKRPLTAIVLAIATSIGLSSLIAIAAPFAQVIFNTKSWRVADAFERAGAICAQVAVGVLVVDAWLLWRWSRHRPVSIPWPWSVAEIEPVPTISRASQKVWRTPTMFGSLLWQEFRHAWWPVALLGGTCLLFMVVFGIAWRRSIGSPPYAVLICLAAIPTMFGVFVFRGEQQEERFRFLAERGVSPFHVWFSKQIIWGASLVSCVTVCITGIAIVVLQMTAPQGWRVPSIDDVFRFYAIIAASTGPVGTGLDILAPAIFLFISYASGQFLSLLVSRSIAAGFLAFVLTSILLGLMMGMVSLGIPLATTIFPLGVVLMLGTLMRTRDWMLQRSGFRRWTPLFALGIVVAFGATMSVAAHRISEIPVRVGADLPPKEFPPVTAEDIRTAEMYVKAGNLIAESKKSIKFEYTRSSGEQQEILCAFVDWQFALGSEKELLEKNQSALQLFMEASKRQGCWFERSGTVRELIYFDTRNLTEIATVVLLSARKLEHEGKLDEAWARYVALLNFAHHCAMSRSYSHWFIGSSVESLVYLHLPKWASSKGQTPEKIIAALGHVELMATAHASIADVELQHARELRQLIESDWADLVSEHSGQVSKFGAFGLRLLQCLPWERERARALCEQVSRIDYIDAVAADQTFFLSDFGHRGSLRQISEETRQKAIPPEICQKTPIGGIFWSGHRSALLSAPSRARNRRGIKLQLALIAYRTRHGKLPATLEELVGPYLTRLPNDPWAGGSFGYRPQGFPHPVVFSSYPQGRTFMPGNPVLWCSGMDAEQLVPMVRFIGQKLEFVRTDSTGLIPSGTMTGQTSTLYAFPLE